MLRLRQSTAAQSVLIGQFVDDTDGATAETGLTIANTDVRLSKNGAAPVAKNSGGATHQEQGFYSVTLDATDTDTVGRLQLFVKMAGALIVSADFEVVEEAVYDALYASGATGDLAVRLQDGAHGGASAVLTLDHIVVSSATDHAIDAKTTGADKNALNLEANTANGIGLFSFGELHGGVLANAGASTGNGLRLVANGDQPGLVVLSSSGDPLNAEPVTQIRDGVLTSQMLESYAANGVAPTLVQAVYAIHQMLMQFGISGTSYTVRQLDNATTAFTVTLDSATDPTDASRV